MKQVYFNYINIIYIIYRNIILHQHHLHLSYSFVFFREHLATNHIWQGAMIRFQNWLHGSFLQVAPFKYCLDLFTSHIWHQFGLANWSLWHHFGITLGQLRPPGYHGVRVKTPKPHLFTEMSKVHQARLALLPNLKEVHDHLAQPAFFVTKNDAGWWFWS